MQLVFFSHFAPSASIMYVLFWDLCSFGDKMLTNVRENTPQFMHNFVLNVLKEPPAPSWFVLEGRGGG